jgi:hypothetical protein
MAERFNDLLRLAQFLSDEWTRAHGDPQGTASALVGPDSFAVLLEGLSTRPNSSWLNNPPAGLCCSNTASVCWLKSSRN